MTPRKPLLTPTALFGLAAAAAGCNSNNLKVLENPPSVAITEPSAGTEFYEGQTINFGALVEPGSAGDDLTSHVHRWVSGNETMCEADAVGADGFGYCSFAFGDTGEKTVEVTVTNARGDRAKASTSVVILENTAPSIEITDPLDGELFANDELVRIDAIVDDYEEDASELVVSISSSLDGDLGVTATPASSGDYSAGIYLSPGTHLITATVEDNYGRSDQDTVEVEIYEHGPPSVDSANITPSPAYTNDTLTATPQGWYDLDGAPERYRYEWYLNSTLDTGEATSTYPSGKTEKGDLVQVVVTPRNDYGDGDPVTSPTIEIQNTPPDAPTIGLTPATPEPEDNIQCNVLVSSYDVDGDSVTYEYEWYVDGAVVGETTNVLDASYTGHNSTIECVVRAYDGEDYSSEARSSLGVADLTAPDAPVLDTPTRYRNQDEATLTGDCEPGCTVTFFCADSATSWTDTETCDSTGAVTYTTSLTRGDTTECYADCEDAAGNLSGASNTVTTEVCDPYDQYEDSTGYGDSGTDPIDEWASLSDAGTTTIQIEANILGSDTEDWFVISTTDDLASDYSSGIDYYNFDVTMTDGSGTYAFLVYKGTADPSDMECSTAYSTTGYTEYSDFVEDVGEGFHAIPSDTRRCGNSDPSYNNCTDFSTDYYIQVFRRASATPSCQHYSLEITNGVW